MRPEQSPQIEVWWLDNCECILIGWIWCESWIINNLKLARTWAVPNQRIAVTTILPWMRNWLTKTKSVNSIEIRKENNLKSTKSSIKAIMISITAMSIESKIVHPISSMPTPPVPSLLILESSQNAFGCASNDHYEVVTERIPLRLY